MLTSQPPYSVSTAPTAPQMPRPNQDVHVQALYPYKAKRKDELDLKKGMTKFMENQIFLLYSLGDVILLLETRNDGWYKGNLNNKIGLFPGNYVANI